MSAVDLITDHLDIWTTAQTPKATGRGKNTNNQSIYGIKKLRELILELAVRGKLVPQDPDDEPASELLESIAKEKARLLGAGKIRPQKTLLDVQDDEQFLDIPTNWIWTRLGIITRINPRNTVDDDQLVSFVPMPLISTSHTGEHGQEQRYWSEVKKGYTHFADGDIGLAKITPCFENSKAVVFSQLRNGIGAGTTELHIARPFGNTLNARFILLYLKSPQFLSSGQTKMTGTAGQKRVPKDFFVGNPLPLPPLAEQHRIVAKVDELMALCDQLEQQQTNSNATHQTLVETLLAALTRPTASADGTESNAIELFFQHFDTLFTTEESIDQLKQTILQLAVMGRLVPQDPNDEPASTLLQKITEEKERLVKAGKIKLQKPLPEVGVDEKLSKLPKGWELLRLGSLLPDFQNGASSRGDKEGKEVIVLRLADISNWCVTLTNTRSLTISESSINKYSMAKDDVLVIRVNGSAEIVGRFILCDRDMDAIYCDHFIRVRFPIQALVPAYLKLLGSSNLIRHRIRDLFVSTAGQKTVNQKHIRSLVVTLPPLAEQHRIIAKVNELMAYCDSLKSRLFKAQTTQLKLADAIVDQAE